MTLAAIIVTLVLLLFMAWHGLTRRAIGALHASFRKRVRDLEPVGVVDPDRLPALIRDFATRNGASGDGPQALAMRQAAQLRLAPGQGFIRVAATQMFSLVAPGFAWVGQGRMFGIVPLGAIDAYAGGDALFDVRLLEAVPVAHASGGPLIEGELLRYLAELPMIPGAILTNAALTFTQKDDRTVSVSTTAGAVTAAVDLIFDDKGDVVETFVPARARSVGSGFAPTPWRGRYADYRQIGPYRVPAHCEVEWLLPEGPFTYFIGDMLALGAPPDAGPATALASAPGL